jgi:hypothetical protein
MTTSAALAAYHGLRAGDRIVAPKSFLDMVQHHALFAGHCAQGHAWAIENVVNVGVTYTRFDHFMERIGTIKHIIPFRGDRWAQQEVLERAQQRLGMRYELTTYNCEHFVNEVLLGQRHSRQADTAKELMRGALVFGALALILRAA